LGDNWSNVRFQELFSEPLRNGLTRPKSVRGAGTRMVNMGEVFAHPRIPDVPMDRVPLSEEEAERYLLQSGDLLFARQSLVLSGAGKCCYVLASEEPRTFESHIIRARLDRKIADPLFYYYLFNSPMGRQRVESIVEQVAAAGIRGRDLAVLDVPFPKLKEQKAVSYILGTMDDKIELNQRINETLESTARAIFKSWFVDFDPVRAKAASRWVWTLRPPLSSLKCLLGLHLA
jgi:type I restriction enzyme, S subunit